jgi:hypothetical protein
MQPNSIQRRFHGAWRLVSPDAEGFLYYDPSGQMSVQSAPRRARHRAGDKPTPAEALAALDGYVAYFGTYSIDVTARTVTHYQLATVQPGAPADLVRAYELVGDDRLILRPVGRPGEIVWQRIGGAA